MSSTVSPITIAVILQNQYDVISASVGLVSILLLGVLLVGQEVARARRLDAQVIAAFDAPVFPLLGAAAVVLILRLLDILV
jgi:hypothetical protein